MITFRFFDQIPQMPASSSDDGRQSGMCQMRHHREIQENELLWSRWCLVSTMRKCWQPTRWPHVVGRRLGVQYACECRESERASTKFCTAAATFSRFGHATIKPFTTTVNTYTYRSARTATAMQGTTPVIIPTPVNVSFTMSNRKSMTNAPNNVDISMIPKVRNDTARATATYRSLCVMTVVSMLTTNIDLY